MRERYFFNCLVCRKKVFDKPSRIKNRRYCSAGCVSIAYKTRMTGNNNPHWQGGRINKTCIICGKIYFVIKSNINKTKFCSWKCLYAAHNKFRSGINSVHWNGGSTSTYKRIRTPQWKLLSTQVKQRDNYTCCICGDKEHRLNVHHIIPYKVGGKDDMDNLMTLCIKCHTKKERGYI